MQYSTCTFFYRNLGSSKKRRRVVESSATDDEQDQSSVSSDTNISIELKLKVSVLIYTL